MNEQDFLNIVNYFSPINQNTPLVCEFKYPLASQELEVDNSLWDNKIVVCKTKILISKLIMRVLVAKATKSSLALLSLSKDPLARELAQSRLRTLRSE